MDEGGGGGEAGTAIANSSPNNNADGDRTCQQWRDCADVPAIPTPRRDSSAGGRRSRLRRSSDPNVGHSRQPGPRPGHSLKSKSKSWAKRGGRSSDSCRGINGADVDAERAFESGRSRPQAAEEAGRAALYHLESIAESSLFLDMGRVDSLPQYGRDEVLVGEFLGSGCFSSVFEVQIGSTAGGDRRQNGQGPCAGGDERINHGRKVRRDSGISRRSKSIVRGSSLPVLMKKSLSKGNFYKGSTSSSTPVGEKNEEWGHIGTMAKKQHPSLLDMLRKGGNSRRGSSSSTTELTCTTLSGLSTTCIHAVAGGGTCRKEECQECPPMERNGSQEPLAVGQDTCDATEKASALKCIRSALVKQNQSEEFSTGFRRHSDPNTVDDSDDDGDGTDAPRYVIKHLRPSVMADPEKFITGAADLAQETLLLSCLSHRNIVKLHGRSAGSLAGSFASGTVRGYFLIMDRLEETLDRRMRDWAKEEVQVRAFQTARAREAALERRAAGVRRRMGVAAQVADALSYLHSRRIVFRDLKPHNIGFDNRGVVKLFDFGFAAELPRLTDGDGGDMDGHLIELCGSARYMAPEIALGRQYGLAVDVYSFGILMWELCCLKRPFADLKGLEDHKRRVAEGGERPEVDRAGWSKDLSTLMAMCWEADPDCRPGIADVRECLAPAFLNNVFRKKDSPRLSI